MKKLFFIMLAVGGCDVDEWNCAPSRGSLKILDDCIVAAECSLSSKELQSLPGLRKQKEYACKPLKESEDRAGKLG